MNSILKYLITLVVGGLIGGLTAYYICTIKEPVEEFNFDALSKIEGFKSALDSSKATAVDTAQARKAIKEFYRLGATDPKQLLSLMACSYEIDFGTILKIIVSLGNQGAGVDPSDLSIRIYPSVWEKAGEKSFSMVFLGENLKDETAINDDSHEDNEVFEYIGPCPFDCPKEKRMANGKEIPNDLFLDKEWDDMLGSINAKKITPRPTPTHP